MYKCGRIDTGPRCGVPHDMDVKAVWVGPGIFVQLVSACLRYRTRRQTGHGAIKQITDDTFLTSYALSFSIPRPSVWGCARQRERVRWDEMLTMYVCRLLCMYVYMMHVFRYLGMYVSIVVCIHVSMYVCMYVVGRYIYILYIHACVGSRVCPNDHVQRHLYIFMCVLCSSVCHNDHVQLSSTSFVHYIYALFLIHILHIYVFLGSRVCPNDLVEHHSYPYMFM